MADAAVTPLKPGPVPPAEGGGAALRVLPAGVGGQCIIGKLQFCGTTERSPKQLTVDVMCVDSDGRSAIVTASGWIASNEGTMTPLGQSFGSGSLAGLMGAEVLVQVRPRVKDNRLYLSVEGIHALSGV